MNSTRIIQELKPLRDSLMSHKIYEQVKTVSSAQVFMKSHVYAVWDFMSLLKSMQQKLTVTKVPWVPCKDRISAYFVNSIVLTEESDNFNNDPNASMSHFELYLQGMKELGGFSEPIESLIKDLSKGVELNLALSRNKKDYSKIIPTSTFDFIEKNLNVSLKGSLEQVTSFFLFGREDPIPDMFKGILREIELNQIKADRFKLYLNRHIQIDSEEHGPISMNILNRICGDDLKKWEIVLKAAQEAIQDRISLWDGIIAQLEEEKGLYERVGGFDGVEHALSQHQTDILVGSEDLDSRTKNLAKIISSALGGPSFEGQVLHSGKVDIEKTVEIIINKARSDVKSKNFANQMNEFKKSLESSFKD